MTIFHHELTRSEVDELTNAKQRLGDSELSLLEFLAGGVLRSLEELKNELGVTRAQQAALQRRFEEALERPAEERESDGSIAESGDSLSHADSGEDLLDAWDRINHMTMPEDGVDGLRIPTGFVDLDNRLNGGLPPAGLVVVGGRPAMGKTALLCNLAIGLANSGKQVQFFSIADTKTDILIRMMAAIARFDSSKIYGGNLNDADRHHLMETSQQLSELPLAIDDCNTRTVAQAVSTCRRRQRDSGLGAVIVDPINQLLWGGRSVSREQELAGQVRRLKALARELNVPVIVAADVKRDVEFRMDQRPRLSDFRDSGALEQDADLVLFLHRPDAYDPSDCPGMAEVIVAKNKLGPVGIVPLTWRKEYGRFESYTRTEPQGGWVSDRSGDF